MKLKPEEFKAKTAEILANLNDQARVSTLLAELSEHNDDAVVEVTTAKATADKLTSDNEKLRSANMTLFLKVGERKSVDDKPATNENTAKYSDLFDENGNLK